MRIKMTPVQIDTLREYLPEWCETADIVLGKSYADIEDSDVAEVYAAFDDVLGRKYSPTAVAHRVHRILREAMPVNGAELPAEAPEDTPPPVTPAVSVDVDTEHVRAEVAELEAMLNAPKPAPDLPHPLMMSAAAIARGEYGDEAKRLAESMDDRPNERQTRWLARLRHKLNSAGLFEAADAIRLVPDI